MAKPKGPVPDGQHTVSIHLVCKNADKAIDFYKKAFGATEISRFPGPDGKIMHATLKLGDALFFLNDEMPMPEGGKSPLALGGTPVTGTNPSGIVGCCCNAKKMFVRTPNIY